MVAQQPEYADELAMSDGRTLAYTEYGDPAGTPVVYCHGTPGTRVSGTVLREVASELGVRVLAPDRPGFGRSEFASDRTLRGWASDVAALADSLDYRHYGVLGFSGGGPFALACAAYVPERVTRCAVVSGVGPPGVATDELDQFDRVALRLARVSPHLCRPLVWVARREIAAADRFTDVVGEPTDGDLADPRVGETGRILLSDVQKAVRQGSLPLATEYGLLGSEWEFGLAGVPTPTRVFHGTADEYVPLAAAEHVAHELPDGRLVRYEDADHFRPLFEHADAVLAWAADGTEPNVVGAKPEAETETSGDGPANADGPANDDGADDAESRDASEPSEVDGAADPERTAEST
jgi:pimeloyl-ACP methyl ester carboxylesterase